MREDHIMQAALRAGRNEEDTVVFTHTSALCDDLPVVDNGSAVSVHSQGTLAVVEAVAEFREMPFTARRLPKQSQTTAGGSGFGKSRTFSPIFGEADTSVSNAPPPTPAGKGFTSLRRTPDLPTSTFRS